MNILPIALNCHREAIRDRILYVILVFALMMISGSILLSFLSVGQQGKIVLDLGLSSISIFGLLITIFIGTNLLNKEIDKRTIYLLITKPLRRYEFILGKHIGLSLTLLIIVLLMTVTFYGLILIFMQVFPFNLLQAICLIYVEMMLLTALAILFSTFSSPIMSAVFTISIYIIGHLSQDLLKLGAISKNPVMEIFTKIMYYVLPDLERLNLKNQIIYTLDTLDISLFLSSLSYGVLYTVALLVLSMIIFERKEF